jgi:hypothetical protein
MTHYCFIFALHCTIRIASLAIFLLFRTLLWYTAIFYYILETFFTPHTLQMQCWWMLFFFQWNIFFTRTVLQPSNYSMLDRVSHALALTKKRAWVLRPLNKLAYFRKLRDAIRGTVCTTSWACWIVSVWPNTRPSVGFFINVNELWPS